MCVCVRVLQDSRVAYTELFRQKAFVSLRLAYLFNKQERHETRKRQVPAFPTAQRLCKRIAAPASAGMRAVKKAMKAMKSRSTPYARGARVGVEGVSGSRKNCFRIV